MYEEYKGKTEIILFLKVHRPSKSTEKRQREAGEKENQSEPKRRKSSGSEEPAKYLSKLSEVQEIVEDLEKRHGDEDNFTMEQFRVWAHMIHILLILILPTNLSFVNT